ncbi:MAG TPA: RNA polymerase sigma factor [Candidatus Eisenbacteria bacterium]
MDRLVTVLARPVYQFGRTFCRNPEDAQDVMQEVLSAAVRSVSTAALRSSLTTWAYTVARNACSRMRRRRVGQPAAFEPLDSAPAGPSDPSRDAESVEIREALRLALVGLPAAHREAVLLCDVEEVSTAEAAAILGINERALKSRLHRGRAALRARLGERFRPARPRPAAPCTEEMRIQSLCRDAGRQRVPARIKRAVRRALVEQL